MDQRWPAVAALGMPWYARDQFARIREIMEDRDRVHVTFDEWEKAAEKGEADLKAQGRRVVRAHIDPDQFIAWCAAEDLRLNAHARNKFAAEVAYRELVGRSE